MAQFAQSADGLAPLPGYGDHMKRVKYRLYPTCGEDQPRGVQRRNIAVGQAGGEVRARRYSKRASRVLPPPRGRNPRSAARASYESDVDPRSGGKSREPAWATPRDTRLPPRLCPGLVLFDASE